MPAVRELKSNLLDEPKIAAPELKRQEHLPILDGLRGLAVLLVFSRHAFKDQTGHGWFLDAIFDILAHGWVGVDLFFVISAFLITGILLHSRTKSNYFKNFYARRFLRIFPLYYGYCFCSIFIVAAAFPATYDALAASAKHDQIWAWTFMCNVLLAMHHNWGFGNHFLDMSHLWSLAIEEHFYIVWPLLVFLVDPRRLWKISAAFLVSSLIMRCTMLYMTHDTLSAYILTPFRLDALAVGALCAIAWTQQPLDRIKKWAPRSFLAMSAVMLFTCTFSKWDIGTTFAPSVGFTLLALFFGSLMMTLLCYQSTIFGRLFLHPIFRFAGKYSYALYVLHESILNLVFLSGISCAVAQFTKSPTLGLLAQTALGLLLSIGAALLSWHLWEKHFLSLKRFFHSK